MYFYVVLTTEQKGGFILFCDLLEFCVPNLMKINNEYIAAKKNMMIKTYLVFLLKIFKIMNFYQQIPAPE